MLEPIHQDPEKFDEICAWCPLPPKLIGEKVFLTAVDPEYSDDILKIMTDEAVGQGFGAPLYKAFTREEQFDVLSVMKNNIEDGFHFLIWDIADKRVVGLCMLTDIKLVHRTAMLGIVIGPREYRCGGRGTDTIRSLLRFAFDEIDLFEVALCVYEFNDAAIACYEKCGFKEYGRRRQSRYIHGKRYDEVLMDILREEYEASKGNVEE